MEVVSLLVRLTVFKTDGRRIPSLVCSIHIYLRQIYGYDGSRRNHRTIAGKHRQNNRTGDPRYEN